MSRTSLDRLTRQVVRYFKTCAAQYGLRPEAISARYILNWGGFVNASFTVGDGERFVHLKLADEEDSLRRLERWRALHEVLEARYRAPQMLGWAAIEKTPFEGPVFEFLPGKNADFSANPALLAQVLDLLTRLHGDQELAARLAEWDGEAETCTDYFLDTYIERFDEDLSIVVGDLPEFVPLKTVDWMQGETRHLEALTRETPAFALPAASPTHGDLWPNNILVSAAGDWRIVDWDDLALGDPALEYSIVLSQIWDETAERDPSGANLLPVAVPADAALKERLAVCLRAHLLDQVIDSLADYVEADFAPEHQAQVKAEKQRIHQAALEKYRRIYD